MACSQKSRRRGASFDAPLDDLFDYARPPARRAARPAKISPSMWKVTDNWPEDMPVTEAEIEVFEAWFGDLFDELFSTRH
jgi:hypothetical protein